MQRYIMNCEGGEKLPIDFDPSKYGTPETAAKAFYEALKPVVEAYGQDPASELFCRESDENGWQVSWEAGPYDWGIVASLDFMFNRKAEWYTEPYYGFDLCFTY